MFDIVENNKKRNNAIFNAKNEINKNNNTCLICGKKVESFCHSHSIPLNIFEGMNLMNNKLCSFETIMQSEIITEVYTGKKNSGIFRNICRECDSTFFKDLDNMDILKEKWESKDLWLQEIRILLYQIYRKEEYILTISKYLNDSIPEKEMEYNFKETKKDVCRYREELSHILKNKSRNYKIIYEKCLNFQTNFCCVTFLSLHLTPIYLWNIIKGNDDKLICESYDKNSEFHTTIKLSKDDRIGSIVYLVILPKDGKTKIILFCNEDSISGMVLDMEFHDLTDDERKLEVISSIISIWGNNLYGNEMFFYQFLEYKKITQYINFYKSKDAPYSLRHSDIEKEYKLMAISKYNLFKEII